MKKIVLLVSLTILTICPVLTHASQVHASCICSCGECGGDHGSDDRGNR